MKYKLLNCLLMVHFLPWMTDWRDGVRNDYSSDHKLDDYVFHDSLGGLPVPHVCLLVNERGKKQEDILMCSIPKSDVAIVVVVLLYM